MKANNVYMGDKFNPDESTCYLQYLDANNLYGWAMSHLLPTGGFRWVSIDPDEAWCTLQAERGELSEWVSDLTRCTDKGYLLEVDIRYPRELT